MAIKLHILDNGDLEIAVHNREEFKDILQREFHDERDYLAEMLDNARYIGNNWECLYRIGLTEAPAIGQGAIYSEDENENDGLPVDYENLWYFPGYMFFSYLEILGEEGTVIFIGHPDNVCKQRNKKTA
jgi:hypothetical protein